jgi:hypothetical protein
VKAIESCKNKEIVCPTCLQYELVSIQASRCVGS